MGSAVAEPRYTVPISYARLRHSSGCGPGHPHGAGQQSRTQCRQAVPLSAPGLLALILVRRRRQAFAAVPQVSAIVVAVRATEIERVQAIVAEHQLAGRVTVVEGGDSRQESVGRALAAVQAAGR